MPRSPSGLKAWHERHDWLFAADPETELLQARDEGRDLGRLERTLAALAQEKRANDPSPARFDRWLEKTGAALDAVLQLPIRKNYPFREPDALPAIRKARRPGAPVPAWKGNRAAFSKQLHGGLLGRICGCMLGKPVEGWWKREIEASARGTGNWPLSGYLRFPSPAEARRITKESPRRKLHSEWHHVVSLPAMHGMVEDDDINYTVIGFGILQKFGTDFTPADVAAYWGSNVPIFHTCTAERVAYRNFVMGILPPASATYRNPYREWIGAQIRADYFGFANPGDPERAAEWAWRDAAISHIRNGIYGEMWVAAMLAAAYTVEGWDRIIRCGLDQIPARSRLHADVTRILDLHAAGATYVDAVAEVHSRWNEERGHDWCHTNSNAQIVAIGLLYGEDNFTQTIARAVMPGFDTDCNGATCGSLWGVRHGVDAIPASWTRPIADTVRTGVTGWHEARISTLAGAMADLAWKQRRR